MRGQARRSTWRQPIEVQRERTPRARGRLVRWSLAGGLLTGALVTGTLVAVDAGPALALCTRSESRCVDSPAGSGSAIAVLPLETEGDASLTVANTDSSGRADVGVLGYLTSDQPAEGSVVRAGSGAEAVVSVARGERRAVTLKGAPSGARAVLVRIAFASGTADTSGSARVTFSSRVDGVSRAQVVEALQAWTAPTNGSGPSADAIKQIAEQVTAELPAPAHLTARATPEPDAVQVAWTLDAGTEDVTAVRISRAGEAADGSKTGQVDVSTGASGTTVKGLLPDTAYTMSVSPVIAGEAGASVVLAVTTPAEPKPSATSTPTPTVTPVQESPSASPTATATATATATSAPDPGSTPSSGSGTGAVTAPPSGWTPLLQQTFDKDASVGGFGSAYPGYSGYNGGVDTSRTAGRAADKTGLWNNATTSSVHDGMYDCRLHTAGGRPQVCALTPIQGGQTYGRYTVRFKTDALPGYKIAYLLWPDTDRWSDGEIDFPEGSLDGTISGSVHDSQGNPSRNAYFVDTKKRMNTWQTATIEWTPGRISFVLDGQSWTTTDSSGMPRGPMHWALQAETEIQAQAPDPSVQGHIYIDWLAAYRYTKG